MFYILSLICLNKNRKVLVGKMERSHQDSHLALIAPIVYIIRACLYIYGMLIGNRTTGQSQEYLPRGGHLT